MHVLALWFGVLAIMIGTSTAMIYVVFWRKSASSHRYAKWIGIGCLVGMVVVAFGLYLYLGSSRALFIAWQRADRAMFIAQLPPEWKDPVKLIQRLQTEVRVHPDSARAWYLLGRLLMTVGHYQEAEMALDHACTLTPGSDCLVQQAETIYNAQGRFTARADVCIQQALIISPNNPDALNLKALSAYSHHQYKIAIQLWRQLLDKLPANSTSATLLLEAISRAESALAKSRFHEKST